MKAYPELTAAMGDFIGNKRPLLTSIDLICRDLER